MVRKPAVVIVTFGADADGVGGVLRQLGPIAGPLVLVDNTPDAPVPCFDGAICIANGNRGGLAGAYNRALEQVADKADLVVFVDQDSDVSVLAEMLADPDVQALLDRDDVAAVAPIYRDRATGMRGRPALLQGRWRVTHLPRQFDDLRRTTMAINSMTIWRMAALRQLGPFDEGLGVDHVDTEMALRAADDGLSIWIAGAHVFDHSIGQRQVWRAFGRTFQTGGHSPDRRRQIGRNTALLARRWGWRFPSFAALALARLGYEAAGIIAVEDRRMAKLGALMRGIAAGFFVRR
ncbi:glycosyltransferase [Paracoccus sp. M683]|uniref:glycosyltransferase n=1 Tax=Paracoccus sp. M683 TaxID=2594268 RepID=UPI00117FB9A6|nr:glycosyltransferase [Paracoccus sp. M683]TRW96040.1 glycosyltransferase [Paracoccus sp. M683]